MGVGSNNAGSARGIGQNPYQQIGASSDPLSGESASPTVQQMAAVRRIDYSHQSRLRGSETISLAPHIKAMWFPLNDGSGAAVVDRVHGLSADLIGTLTNAWDNPGYLTFATNTAARLLNSPEVQEIMRLDTLTGSLIVGFESAGPTVGAASALYAWGYGDAGQSTGFIGGVLNNSQLTFLNYRGVSGSLTTGAGVMGNLKTMARHVYHLVIHRNLLDGRLYVEGYVDGWQSRAARVAALEGTDSPPGDNSRGLRIGARATGASATTSYIGTNGTSPQLANFHAIRVDGDYRHRIPDWIDNICQTIPYGAVPEVLNNG